MTCLCGCGTPTPLAIRSNRRSGLVKGQPVRFINGHQHRSRTREANPNWRGGRSNTGNGYLLVYDPTSPMADGKGYALEHRYVMAKHIGRPLTSTEVVHHRNGDKTDNRIENLELFASQADHARFHMLAAT